MIADRAARLLSPTSGLVFMLTPAASGSISCIVPPIGMLRSWSCISVVCPATFTVSTTGLWPETWTVSVSAPIFIKTSTLPAEPVVRCTSVRADVWNPESSNVTLYTPGGSSRTR